MERLKERHCTYLVQKNLKPQNAGEILVLYIPPRPMMTAMLCPQHDPHMCPKCFFNWPYWCLGRCATTFASIWEIAQFGFLFFGGGFQFTRPRRRPRRPPPHGPTHCGFRRCAHLHSILIGKIGEAPTRSAVCILLAIIFGPTEESPKNVLRCVHNCPCTFRGLLTT